MRVLVLPSPLLGPVGYRPLAGALGERGHSVSLGECREPIGPARLIDDWSAAAETADLLVAHSNAGYLAANVTANAGGRPVLFMDAALPPASGPTRLAPSGLMGTLADLCEDDGLLPPWTRWWSAEEMARLLPPPWFERVDAHAPRLALDYFRSTVEPPPDWSAGRCAYLAFGATYAAELAFARDLGWRTAELVGHHLWHVAHPNEVAALLDELAAALSG